SEPPSRRALPRAFSPARGRRSLRHPRQNTALERAASSPRSLDLGYGCARMPLPTFEIEPTEPQRGTVIWLHGLGASHHDFLPVVPELGVPFLRFVFPAAPVRRLTISRGM